MLNSEIAALLQPGAPASLTLGPAMLPTMRQEMRQAGMALPLVAVQADDHRVGTIPLRLYKPENRTGSRLPLLLFLHGGGWILGDLETHDAPCRLLCQRAECAVLAVEYSLAPDRPFPAALDDCVAAFRWACDNAEALGCDRERIAVGGESAGANLAAAVAIMLRDGGDPAPAFQFLVHPATDLTLSQPSIDEVGLPGFGRSFLEQCVRMYAGDRDLAEPLLSPLRCDDLSGLPRAVVYTVEVDPLRDDGEAYALALARAGNEVLIQRLPGLPHGFMFLAVTLSAVDRAFDLLAERLAAYFRVR